MPPPMPSVSTWSAASSAVFTPWAIPRATPAADRSATRMTARPFADSQPKKAAPHLIPPKVARWATTASRAEPRETEAPSVRVVGWSRSVWLSWVSPWRAMDGLLSAGTCPRWFPADQGVDALVSGGQTTRRSCRPYGGRSAGPPCRREVEVPVLLVDAANVVGARPDGWWRDRAGATARLLERLALAGPELTAPDGSRVTEVVAIVEGRARDVRGP